MSATEKQITDIEWFQQKQRRNEAASFTSVKYHVLRLTPGEDLLDSLWRYARVTGIKAGSIVSCVGSLQKTNVRYSNAPTGTVIEGDHFEIISLVGNIDFQSNETQQYPSSMGVKTGSGHVHIALSDKNGHSIGGHLLSGNIVYTTAEITLVEFLDGQFSREFDEKPEGSGYYELKVHKLES
jgi:predicted DNA-binding protein with PD1-like motif